MPRSTCKAGRTSVPKSAWTIAIHGGVITYTVVNDADALQAMRNDLAGNYAVGSDIDLGSIANWQPVGDAQ